jgi:hypothetical protein
MSNDLSVAGVVPMSPDGNSELQNYQYEGYQYLYNLEPQQLNYFAIDSFYDPYIRADGDSGEGTYDSPSSVIPDKLQYRIESISGFRLPGLDIMESQSAIRIDYVKGAKDRNNTLTLNWKEDVYQTVRRYHINWMNHWYDKYLDCMVCGRRGKYRNLAAYLFHYKNMNTTSGVPIMKAVPIALVNFIGLVPKDLGEMQLSYAENGNVSSVTIQYQMNGMEMYFYPYDEEDKKYIGGMAEEVQKVGSDGNIIQTKIMPTSTWDANGAPLSTGAFAGVTDSNHSSVYYL